MPLVNNSPWPGPCPQCCTPGSCLAPVLYSSTIAASGSKCGATDSSQPNKWFLQTILTEACSFSASTTGTPPTGLCAGKPAGYSYTSASCGRTVTTSYDPTSSGCPATTTYSGPGYNYSESSSGYLTCDGSPDFCGTSGDTNSATAAVDSSSGYLVGTKNSNIFDCGANYPSSGSINSPSCASLMGTSCTESTSYSDEYTTAELISNVEAKLGGYPAFSEDYPPVASYELNSTGSSFSVENSQYYFKFQVPSGVGGKPDLCYKITWNETFTPDGGASVKTAKSYTWTGPKPSGYDPSNPATWPQTATFTMTIPSSNGQTTITDITYACAGC